MYWDCKNEGDIWVRRIVESWMRDASIVIDWKDFLYSMVVIHNTRRGELYMLLFFQLDFNVYDGICKISFSATLLAKKKKRSEENLTI